MAEVLQIFLYQLTLSPVVMYLSRVLVLQGGLQ
jgi:hypothetical protein